EWGKSVGRGILEVHEFFEPLRLVLGVTYIWAQLGATVGEVGFGYVRIADLIVSASNDRGFLPSYARTQTLWGMVHHGLWPLILHPPELLPPTEKDLDPEREKLMRERHAADKPVPQGNPGQQPNQ